MFLHLMASHRIPFDWDSIDATLELKDEVYETMAAGKLRLKEGTRKLLTACNEEGWRLAVVQKGSRQRINFELREVNLDTAFMVKVSLLNMSASQQQIPYTTAYKEAQMRMQVPAHSVAVIETSPITTKALPIVGMAATLVGVECDGIPAIELKTLNLPKVAATMFREEGMACDPGSVPAAVPPLAVGSSVLARSAEDGMRYQGVVKAVGLDGITVTFTGYNNTEVVAPDNVYALAWPHVSDCGSAVA